MFSVAQSTFIYLFKKSPPAQSRCQETRHVLHPWTLQGNLIAQNLILGSFSATTPFFIGTSQLTYYLYKNAKTHMCVNHNTSTAAHWNKKFTTETNSS